MPAHTTWAPPPSRDLHELGHPLHVQAVPLRRGVGRVDQTQKSWASLAPIMMTTTWGSTVLRSEVSSAGRWNGSRPDQTRLSRASSAALTTPVWARSDWSGPPRSRPRESPTMSTRRGFAAVGVFGFGPRRRRCGRRLPALWSGAGARLRVRGRLGPRARHRESDRSAGNRFDRPVIETKCESCRARLMAATGPVTSRLTVRRAPTGETSTLCCAIRREQEEPQARRHRCPTPKPRPREARPAVLGRRQLGMRV